ncbi:MAG: hypothetical protein IH867_13670 [Chloroflexi bacterium]|nr:hypothetical protein [Chloroflexota bacterium]
MHDQLHSLDFTDTLVDLVRGRDDLLRQAGQPDAVYVMSASEDIELSDWSVGYQGEGIWYFTGTYDWHVLVDYFDLIGWDPSHEYEDDLELIVEFSGYYNHALGAVESLDLTLLNSEYD